jgi:uncharacterized oxidoreductase
MPRFSPEALTSVTQTILEAVGTPVDIAQRVTEVLINSNLAGHDSHGILRIPSYLEEVDKQIVLPASRPQILRQTPTIATMASRKCWGHYAVDQAMRLAIEKARTSGIGVVTLGLCNHTGRMGDYVEMAAREGLIGMTLLGYGGQQMGFVAPYGGVERSLATNPISIAVPVADAEPFVLDFATTIASRGKLKVAQSKGELLPEGWIINKDGHASIDPEDFFQGGSLLPLGLYKGYGLALMNCLLGGLSGAFQPEFSRMGGVYVQVIDINAFTSPQTYQENVKQFLEAIRSTRRLQEDEEILIPGEPEARQRQQRWRDGIDVPSSVWQQITAAAAARNIKLEVPDPVGV